MRNETAILHSASWHDDLACKASPLMSFLKRASITSRQRLPEIMDRPDLDADEHAAALRGLGRINVLSRSGSALWPTIARLAREGPGTPLRVLDVACGGGDVIASLARRAARARLDVRFAGCDISAQALDYTRNRLHGRRVDLLRLNVLRDRLPDDYDVILSTLFLHHLDEFEAVELLRRMGASARRAILVDDLLRSRTGLIMAWTACRFVTASSVVHHDGPASVSSAFTLDEIRSLAGRAGLDGATFSRHWPQRVLLSWRRA
jgi:SAM-dependent methyltransferase